ncbi:MAG: Lrp/AsnC family transcriptional regulator [Candidatus Bathyarchaeota archaeon]|nr:Lrp/AsnC family transcriptional regulator [Candidatus Bathyarchaeota archaeon]
MRDLAQKIDEIDAKILRDLLVDGRKEFTEIAKEAGVSKDIIWQHYTKMKKDGVIVGSTVQLNYAALGYIFSTSFFVSVELQKQDEIIKNLQRIPGIYDAYPCGCNSELWTIGTFKSTTELEQVKHSIKRVPSVIGLRTEILTGIKNMPENLSVFSTTAESKKTNKKEPTERREKEKSRHELDEIDLQIIEKLAVDGRASFNKIAKELKISTSTASKRYSILKQEGIIKTLIQINTLKLGYIGNVIISVAISTQEKMNQIIEKLLNTPDIEGLWKTSGFFDLSIFIKIKSLEHLLAIHDEFSKTPGIVRMETSVLNRMPLMPYPKEHLPDF